MTNPPPRPGDDPGWVDPDAPTGLAPQQQRPPAPGWRPPPTSIPPAPQGPTPYYPPPWPQQPQHTAAPGQWPSQPQPDPAQHRPSPAYGAPPPFDGRPPSTKRRNIIIGSIAAAVVAVIVTVVGIAATSRSTGSAASMDMTPADTAKAYLEALSSGDAAKALSFGNAQPANTDLLTDEVLHEQLAKMPISNIRILDVDKSMESIGTSMVHVAVNFGQVVDDVRLELTLGADKKTWKLTTAAIKVDPPLGSDMNKAEQTVTIFGKNFKNGSLYIFPGYLDVSSSNDYLTATAQPLLLDHLQTYMSASLDPDVNLNPDGRKAINDELVVAFAKCQGSNQLAPPGCPAKVGFNDAVDGTLTWGPADLSGVTIGDLSAFDLTVLVAGSADFPLSYRTTSGDTKQGTATAYLGGSADISQHPPRLNLR